MVSYILKQFVDDMGLKVDFPQFNSYAYKFLHLRVVVKQLTLEHSMQNREDIQGNKLKDFTSSFRPSNDFSEKIQKNYPFLSHPFSE